MFRSSLTVGAGLLLATFTSAQCRVTRPADPAFVPPAAYAFKTPNPAFFAYGTEALWTDLQVDGKWLAFGKEGDGWVYETKLTFWHRGFDWRKDEANLKVTGKRLDGDAPTVKADHANAVFLPSRDAAGMMTLLAVPTVGCWEITAHYEGNDLSFVVSVEAKPRAMTTEELEMYGDFLDAFLGIQRSPTSFIPTWSGRGLVNLFGNTVPLIVPPEDKDGCLKGMEFQNSEAANQRTQEIPASITKGRPVRLFDPNESSPTVGEAEVLRLSEIGFDDDHRFAAFTFRLSQGAYMEGGTLVFRKNDGKWTQSAKACSVWMS